jgi:microcystin-dependent protein
MGYSAFSGLGSGNSGNRRTVRQVNNFVPGEVIRMSTDSSGLYVSAIADSAENAEAVGIVETATTSSFTVVTAGEINLNNVSYGDLPSVAGDVYFLSSTVAGQLTTTAPSVTGTIKKTMMIGVEQGKGMVVNYIGLVSGFDATDSVRLEGIQPLGSIIPYAGDIKETSNIPIGWLLCDGEQFNSADFPELALLLGETHGPRVGNLYRVPDMRGRSPLGVNTSNSTMAQNTLFSTREIGYQSSSGKEEEILGVSQIPSHNHGGYYVAFKDDMGNDAEIDNTIDGVVYGFGTPSTSPEIADQSTNTIHMNTSGPILGTEWNLWETGGDDQDYGKINQPISVEDSGGGQPHNIMHPFTVVNYLIRASGDVKASILTVNLRDLADVDSTSSCGGSCAGECNVPQNGDVLIYSTTKDSNDGTNAGNGDNKFVVTASTNPYRNVLMNGNFDVWQRGTVFTSTTTTGSNTFYTADRWRISDSSSSTLSASQSSSTHPFASGYTSIPGKYSLQLFCTLGSDVSSSNYTGINYDVGGYDFATLLAAKCATMSFWVKSNTVGTYCISFKNHDNTISYVSEYTIDNTNTWYYKTVTIPTPPNPASGWNYSTDMIGLRVMFVTSSGTDYHTTAGNWQTANALSTANQVNAAAVADTTNPMLEIAQVQLEAGSVATPYQAMSWDDTFAKCQRWFQKSYEWNNVPGTVTGRGRQTENDWVISNTAHFNTKFERRMRNEPEVVIWNPATGAKNSFSMIHRESGSSINHAVATGGVGKSTTNIYHITRTTASTLNAGYKNKIQFHYTADAEYYVDNVYRA